MRSRRVRSSSTMRTSCSMPFFAGHGLAYMYDDMIAADVKAFSPKRVLEKCMPTFPGYYLYHPSRRQTLLAPRL